MSLQELTYLLQQNLQPQEYLLWSQQPDLSCLAHTWPRFHGSFGLSGMLRLLVLLFAIVIILVLPLAQAYDLVSQTWEVIMLLTSVPISVILYKCFQVYQMQKLLQQTLYGVTNQRVIFLTVTPTRRVTASYGPSDLAEILCIERIDGFGDILFGQPQVQRMSLALRTVTSGFVGIEEVRHVEQFIVRLRLQTQGVLAEYR